MNRFKGVAVLAALVLALTASCPPPVTTTPAPVEVPVTVPARCPEPTLMAEDGSCVNPNFWDAPATPVPTTELPACKVD